MAVADASFRTVKVSMSFELIELSGLDIPVAPVALSTGTPSSTMSGSLLAHVEEPPPIRIVDEEPGAQPAETTLGRATCPARRSAGAVARPLLSLVASTATTERVA